ncbi:GSTE3.2 family protein [Megaselia abdita]
MTVLMLIQHINISIDLRVIDLFKGELFSAQCSVPSLIDGDSTIKGSDAISIYLIDKYAKEEQLYPMDQEKLSLIHSQLQFLNVHLHSNFLRLFESVISRNTLNSFDDIKAKIYNCYESLDLFLKDFNFMGGNVITIADFSCLPTMLCLNEVCLVDEKYSNLELWMSQMESLIFFDEVNECAENLKILFKKSFKMCS